MSRSEPRPARDVAPAKAGETLPSAGGAPATGADTKPAWATAEAKGRVAEPEAAVKVKEGQPVAADQVDGGQAGKQATETAPLQEGPPVPLGRGAGAGAATAAAHPKPLPKPPRLSPRQRLRRYAVLVTSGRFIGGVVLLGLLFLLLTSGQAWPTLLFGWVLLTILADEFDGWFGYVGALMGLLTLFGPSPSGDPVWQVILPLVGGGLLGLLLVKHSGGPLVLPFAGAVFALPLYAAANYGELLDGNLIVVANPDLFRSAVVAMLMGLGVSLVRQLIAWATGVQARYAERRLLRADQGQGRAETPPAADVPAR